MMIMNKEMKEFKKHVFDDINEIKTILKEK